LPKNRTGRADEERLDVLDEGGNRPAVLVMEDALVRDDDGVGLTSMMD